MVRPITVLPSVVNVAAGSTAFINLPLGPVYDGLQLEYTHGTGATPTLATLDQFGNHFEEIRIKIDGEAKQTYRGFELARLNAFYGRTHVPGRMPIYFSPPWIRSQSSEDGLGWGTRDVRAFTIEFELKSTVNNPRLVVRAIQRPGEVNGQSIGLGLHRVVRRYVGNAGSAGVLEWTDLPLDPNARLLAAHFWSAAITKMEVKANQRVIFDADHPTVNDWYTRPGVNRAHQLAHGIFHVDFTENNRISDGLPLAGLQDLRFQPTFASADSFVVQVETLENHVFS